MVRLLILQALLAGAAMAGCSGDARETSAPNKTETRKAVMPGEIERRFGGYVETISVAKAAGYDYLNVVGDCLSDCPQRRKQALHDLLVMTTEAGFDAAASEGHSGVLGFVLSGVGDTSFGEGLEAEPAPIQKDVRDALLFDLGYGNTDLTAEDIRRRHPRTFPSSYTFPH